MECRGGRLARFLRRFSRTGRQRWKESPVSAIEWRVAAWEEAGFRRRALAEGTPFSRRHNSPEISPDDEAARLLTMLHFAAGGYRHTGFRR